MYRGAWSLALLLVTCTNAQLSGNGSPNLNPLDINSLLTAQINGEEMPSYNQLNGIGGIDVEREASAARASLANALQHHAPVMANSGVVLDPVALSGFTMDPDDLTVDGEVVCQTVKEALLALKTVSADQLKSAATYEHQGNQVPAARKLLALNRQTSPGTGVIPENQDVEMILLQNGQTVPAACPGEIAGLNFGSCINYFFTVNCVRDHQGLIDDLIGPAAGMRPKTLDDFRQVVISIFKAVPPCKTTDQFNTVVREHTCQDSVERLGAMQYPQLIRNAIAKVESQLSPTNTEVMRTVSATVKQFANLGSPQSTVMIGSPLDDRASQPSGAGEGARGEQAQEEAQYSSPTATSTPIFVCILALSLGAIGLAVYYLRKEELFDRMGQVSRATVGYAKMMSKTVEASKAAFGTSSASTLSSRSEKKTGNTGKRPSSTTQDPTKDGIPALQAKLQMLREATASASASEL